MDKKMFMKLRDEIDEILNKMEKMIEKKEKILQLEDKNFHVDSSDWKFVINGQNITYLENPNKDICEYIGGVPEVLLGQQLFTWQAGIRETKKAGKRMPTDEEWNVLTDGGKNFGFNLKKVFSGYRIPNGGFRDLSSSKSFWSSSSSGSDAWMRFRRYGNMDVYCNMYNKDYGFSVLCLEADP